MDTYKVVGAIIVFALGGFAGALACLISYLLRAKGSRETRVEDRSLSMVIIINIAFVSLIGIEMATVVWDVLKPVQFPLYVRLTVVAGISTASLWANMRLLLAHVSLNRPKLPSIK